MGFNSAFKGLKIQSNCFIITLSCAASCQGQADKGQLSQQ